MKVNEALNAMLPGEIIQVSSTDMGFARDAETWCKRTGNTFLGSDKNKKEYLITIQKGEQTVSNNSCPSSEHQKDTAASELQNFPQGKTIIVFDGDFDKALAAFT